MEAPSQKVDNGLWSVSACPCGHQGAAQCAFLAGLRRRMAGMILPTA
jgi:hypothetical protein